MTNQAVSTMMPVSTHETGLCREQEGERGEGAAEKGKVDPGQAEHATAEHS
jgi:hypothetical protein